MSKKTLFLLLLALLVLYGCASRGAGRMQDLHALIQENPSRQLVLDEIGEPIQSFYTLQGVAVFDVYDAAVLVYSRQDNSMLYWQAFELVENSEALAGLWARTVEALLWAVVLEEEHTFSQDEVQIIRMHAGIQASTVAEEAAMYIDRAVAQSSYWDQTTPRASIPSQPIGSYGYSSQLESIDRSIKGLRDDNVIYLGPSRSAQMSEQLGHGIGLGMAQGMAQRRAQEQSSKAFQEGLEFLRVRQTALQVANSLRIEK